MPATSRPYFLITHSLPPLWRDDDPGPFMAAFQVGEQVTAADRAAGSREVTCKIDRRRPAIYIGWGTRWTGTPPIDAPHRRTTRSDRRSVVSTNSAGRDRDA